MLSSVSKEDVCFKPCPLIFFSAHNHGFQDEQSLPVAQWFWLYGPSCEQIVAGSGGSLVAKDLHMWADEVEPEDRATVLLPLTPKFSKCDQVSDYMLWSCISFYL